MPKIITDDNRLVGMMWTPIPERAVKVLAKTEGKTLINKKQYKEYLQRILPILIEEKIKSNIIEK